MSPTFTFQLAPGEAGISESLAGMAAIVRHVPTSKTLGTGLLVNRTAKLISLTHPTPSAYMQRVYTFLRDNITFNEDPPFVELVRHPDELLGMIAAGRCRCDCDEVATLGASLLWSRGIEPLFIVTGRLPHRYPTGAIKLGHVFYAAGRPGARHHSQVVPFDPQDRVPAGTWRVPEPDRIETYPIIPEKKAA